MLRPTIALSSVVLLLCMLETASATAQGIRSSVGVGVILPTGASASPTGDSVSNQTGFRWQGMVFLDLTRPRSRIGIRVDGTYSENNSGPPDLHTRLLGGSLNLTYALPGSAPVRPYLLTGAGLYKLRLFSTSGGVGVDTSTTKLAWNVGGGVGYHLGGVVLFTEARYSSVGRLVNASARDYRYVGWSVQPTHLAITLGIRFAITLGSRSSAE